MSMTKQEFKQRWESDEIGGGITFYDIAECAKDWGIASTPRTMQIDRVLYLVLKAAGTQDAEEFANYTISKVKRLREALSMIEQQAFIIGVNECSRLAKNALADTKEKTE